MKIKLEFTEEERDRVNKCESRDMEDLCCCIDCPDYLECRFCPMDELNAEEFVEFVNKNTKKKRGKNK